MGHGEKAQRRDSRGIKEGERPKILMDSPEDADIFHGEDIKVNWAALLEVHIRQNLQPSWPCRSLQTLIVVDK